ncbi:hypothetical protein MUK42_37523, partial [Musa troglodytarum]
MELDFSMCFGYLKVMGVAVSEIKSNKRGRRPPYQNGECNPNWIIKLGSSMALVTFKTKAERLHKNPDKMEASLSANISEFDAARNYIRLTEDMKPEKLLATRAKAKTTADRDAPFLL